ncbi:hypothetical protein M514_02820 [Trichuris suis]|uniref:Uncharacterized protein n=1 Tax=Trichuris suis TaxID=68888 RepID=A0A085NEN6_9BILA|nr:hypothetical protein M514_02820 [Trichuris suis]
MDTQRNSVSPCLLLGEVTINPQQRAVEIEDHDLYCAAPWNDAHVGKSSVPSDCRMLCRFLNFSSQPELSLKLGSPFNFEFT